jgi:hypothetical protein
MSNTEDAVLMASETIWGRPGTNNLAASAKLIDVLHARLLLQCGIQIDLADYWDEESRWSVRRSWEN